MLVRCGMKDNLRPRQRKDTLTAGNIATVADTCVKQQVRELATQLLLDPVEVVLGQLENRQRSSPRRATCLHSSEPIEPPPPVTRTRFPEIPVRIEVQSS